MPIITLADAEISLGQDPAEFERTHTETDAEARSDQPALARSMSPRVWALAVACSAVVVGWAAGYLFSLYSWAKASQSIAVIDRASIAEFWAWHRSHPEPTFWSWWQDQE